MYSSLSDDRREKETVTETRNFIVNIPCPAEQHRIIELAFQFDAHNVMSCYNSQAEEEAAAQAGPIGEGVG